LLRSYTKKNPEKGRIGIYWSIVNSVGTKDSANYAFDNGNCPKQGNRRGVMIKCHSAKDSEHRTTEIIGGNCRLPYDWKKIGKQTFLE